MKFDVIVKYVIVNLRLSFELTWSVLKCYLHVPGFNALLAFNSGEKLL